MTPPADAAAELEAAAAALRVVLRRARRGLAPAAELWAAARRYGTAARAATVPADRVLVTLMGFVAATAPLGPAHAGDAALLEGLIGRGLEGHRLG